MTLRNYLEKNYSKSTLTSNLYNIKKFTNYYLTTSQIATYEDVLNYLDYIRKNYNLHPKTLKNQLHSIKIYFNYLLETGQRTDHPCSELQLKDKIDRELAVDNLYSSETLERFFETYQIKKKKHLENRNKVMISLLIYQALTVQELANLKVEDVDLEKSEIVIKGNLEVKSKSPQSRTLSLQAKQILLIYRYLKEDRVKLLNYNFKNPKEGSFILGQYGEKINAHSISKMINENRKKEDKIQPLKIRQSVIANLLKRENDTRIVQVFCGHRRASTTQNYKQTELEILQNAINQYHPIS